MPIPDVIEGGSDDDEIISLLDAGLRKLESSGADFSFIACNTMQGFLPALREKYDMLSIVEETLKEAGKSDVDCWGILATEVTISKGFYQQAFSKAGISTKVPDQENQRKVTAAIRGILAGRDMSSARDGLLEVVSALKDEGAGGIILACTDLPIVLSEDIIGLPALDTADVIARAAVDYYNELKE
uniref:Aspartate racemase n=1 Tax=Candidatus Methanophaga sp. ANME-1 ERB7 TaxID=2759913 RepID=A0A7G9Z2I7_9EURY|nr:aspartate racemase [Methanosarcinales archaeon ANME-1 ERB7]